jgi:hypothetical protein
MNKFVTQNGRSFMLVTPVKSLLNSTMIAGIVASGRQFVVDMNTGELTILSSEADVRTVTFVTDLSNKPKALAKDFEVACLQISDEILVGATKGYVSFYSNTILNSRIVWIDEEDGYTIFLGKIRNKFNNFFSKTI